MKFSNEAFIKELIKRKESNFLMEGSLYHRKKASKKDFKLRWFQLRANLLFYYKTNVLGLKIEDEPKGLLVLTNCEVVLEKDDSFSVKIGNEENIFKVLDKVDRRKWVSTIQVSNISFLKNKIDELKTKLSVKNPNISFVEINPRIYQKRKCSKVKENTKRNKSVDRKEKHKQENKEVIIPKRNGSRVLEQMRKSYSLSYLMIDSENEESSLDSSKSSDLSFPTFNFEVDSDENRNERRYSFESNLNFNHNVKFKDDTHLGSKKTFGKYLTVDYSDHRNSHPNYSQYKRKTKNKLKKIKKFFQKNESIKFKEFPAFIDTNVLFAKSFESNQSDIKISKSQISLGKTMNEEEQISFVNLNIDEKNKLRKNFLFPQRAENKVLHHIKTNNNGSLDNLVNNFDYVLNSHKVVSTDPHSMYSHKNSQKLLNQQNNTKIISEKINKDESKTMDGKISNNIIMKKDIDCINSIFSNKNEDLFENIKRNTDNIHNKNNKSKRMGVLIQERALNILDKNLKIKENTDDIKKLVTSYNKDQNNDDMKSITNKNEQNKKYNKIIENKKDKQSIENKTDQNKCTYMIKNDTKVDITNENEDMALQKKISSILNHEHELLPVSKSRQKVENSEKNEKIKLYVHHKQVPSLTQQQFEQALSPSEQYSKSIEDKFKVEMRKKSPGNILKSNEETFRKKKDLMENSETLRLQ